MQQRGFEIVEESDAWAVVEKPAGLLVHPSKPDGKRTLWHGLRELFAYELAAGGQVSIVTRLDRETSGLVLVAKSHAQARVFGLMNERRELDKRYRALVWGWPEWDETTVDAPLLRQGDVMPSRVYLRQMIHPGGAPSVTRFRVLERFRKSTTAGDRFAIVEAFLETGRMHQIRVHLASTGHSVVGDKLYGPGDEWYLRFIETGWTRELEEALLLPRHALHASRLEVPGLGAWNSGLPADMRGFIDSATS